MSCTEGKPFFPRNVIMKTEDHSASTIAAMIASCTPVALQGARSTMSRFESAENPRKRMSCSSYSALDLSDEMGDEDGSDDCGGHPGEKKRRLTFEQVKTLEKNFELGNKLDPERKMYLATTLGLQPRQIAIWFQNRRARWKTKQLERDFDVLKQDYEALKANYDILLQENKKFEAEVQRLSSKLEKDGENLKVNGSKESENASARGLVQSISPMELSVKSEISAKSTEPLLPSASDPFCPTRKKLEQEGCSSIVSEASSVLNIDSPHTIDSPLSPVRQMASPPPLNEGVRDQLPSSCSFRTTGPFDQSATQKLQKMEENFLINQDESCCNLFYNLEEAHGSLLWEFWPQGL